MDFRTWTSTFAGGVLATAMRDLNARHPWSHNDHFHSWILTNLPARRRTALDVGCGHGELVATLAPYFDAVWGVEVDAATRRVAAGRCSGLANATVTGDPWSDVADEITRSDRDDGDDGIDLVTMIAVLHHLDVPTALRQVSRLLAPGGRFLAVGLAPPTSVRDHAWDVFSMVTNPLIGYVKHPWPSRLGPQPPPFPIREPTLSFDQLRDLVDEVMPRARMRHHVGFRHTIAWSKPR